MKIGDILIDDNLVDKFSDYMKRFPELYSNLTDLIFKNIQSSIKKPLIVDLGVGPGLLSIEILNRFSDVRVIGIDPSVEMINHAKKTIKNDNFQAKLGKAEDIPLDSGKVDVVVSRFTLTYWDNPSEGFLEINRVLKPSGIFIFEVLNKDFPKWRLFLLKLKMHIKSADSNVIKYHIDAYKTAYSFDYVEQLFRDSNFEIFYKEYDKKAWKFLIIAKKK